MVEVFDEGRWSRSRVLHQAIISATLDNLIISPGDALGFQPRKNLDSLYSRPRILESIVTPSNRSYFLNELNGFALNTGILVLATANHPELLDPALTERPSRFDRKYNFDLPAEGERESYIRKTSRLMLKPSTLLFSPFP